MATDETEETGTSGDDTPAKSRGKGKVLVVALAGLVVAGGGFAAAWTGMLDAFLPQGDAAEAVDGDAQDAMADAPAPHVPSLGGAFVEVPPISVSLGTGGQDRQLRMRAVLDVAAAHAGEAETLVPRVQDTILEYLRAVDAAALEDPLALGRLRAQMLRRARMVLGEGAVSDLLVTDFVLQ